MRKKPLIQDFTVPDHVFVNMQNGGDYVKVPLKNLDEAEINKLCATFIQEVVKRAGYSVVATLDIVADIFEDDGDL